MKVVSQQTGSCLVFTLFPDNIDTAAVKRTSVVRSTCSFHLPTNWNISDLHGDLYGLAVSLIVLPYTASRLELDRPVSSTFAATFAELTQKSISPVDPSIRSRGIPEKPIPGLAFSGGVDSSAAMALLPASAALVFLERCAPENTLWPGKYDKSAPLSVCDHHRSQGRNITLVQTDIEFIRNPAGFPVDLSNGVPAILLADYLSLDSLAYGMILESAYKIGHERYENYAQRSHYRLWGPLFAAAGLPLNMVTAGVSEVGTSKIVLQSTNGEHVQSCMRGKPDQPCFDCWKCFRKTLLDLTLRSVDLPASLLDKAFSIKEAIHYLTANPIKHQNVIEYICSRYHGRHPSMSLLKNKVCWHGNVDYLTRWYPPSLDLIAPMYRDSIYKRLCEHLDTM